MLIGVFAHAVYRHVKCHQPYTIQEAQERGNISHLKVMQTAIVLNHSVISECVYHCLNEKQDTCS